MTAQGNARKELGVKLAKLRDKNSPQWKSTQLSGLVDVLMDLLVHVDKDHDDQVSRLEAQVEEETNSLQGVRQEVDNLQAALETGRANVTKATREVESLESQLGSARQETKSKDEEITSLKQRLNEASNLQKELESSRAEITEAKGEIRSLKTQITSLKRSLEEASNLQPQLSKAQEQLKASQDEVSKYQDEVGRLKEQVTCAEQKSDIVREQVGSVKEELRSLTGQMLAVQQEAKDARDELLAAQAYMAELEVTIENAQDDLQAAKAEAADAIDAANEAQVSAEGYFEEATRALESADAAEDQVISVNRELLAMGDSEREACDRLDRLLAAVRPIFEERFAGVKEMITNLNDTLGNFIYNQLADKEDELADKDEQLATKEDELAAKDKQLAAKERQVVQIRRLAQRAGDLKAEADKKVSALEADIQELQQRSPSPESCFDPETVAILNQKESDVIVKDLRAEVARLQKTAEAQVVKADLASLKDSIQGQLVLLTDQVSKISLDKSSVGAMMGELSTLVQSIPASYMSSHRDDNDDDDDKSFSPLLNNLGDEVLEKMRSIKLINLRTAGTKPALDGKAVFIDIVKYLVFNHTRENIEEFLQNGPINKAVCMKALAHKNQHACICVLSRTRPHCIAIRRMDSKPGVVAIEANENENVEIASRR